MRGFLHGLASQLRQLLGTARYLGILALFLAACWLGMAAYARMVATDIPVAVLDLDGSALSRTVLRFVAATRDVRVVAETPRSLEEAEELLVAGKLAAVLLVPDGFSASLKHGRRGELLLAVDMSNIVTGKTAFRAIQRAALTVGAGAQLTVVRKLGEPRARALARVQPLVVSDAFEGNPATNYAVYVVPGLVFFFLHLLALFYGWAPLLPPREGEGVPALAGRLLAGVVVTFPLGLFLAYGLLRRVEITPQAPLGAVTAVLLAFLVADALLPLVFRATAHKLMTGFQATVIVGMLSLMFSGITWPTDAFPAPIRAFAALVPFTPFARAMRVFLHLPSSLSDLRGPLAQLGLQIALFLFVGTAGGALRAWVLRRRPA